MAFGQMGLGSVVAMIGGNVYNTPQAIFEGVATIASTMAGLSTVVLNRTGGGSGLTAATVGQVSAYTSSDFNAYTGYVNKCYAEVEEPLAELSSIAAELAETVKGAIKASEGEKNTNPGQAFTALRDHFMGFYYPDTTEEQIANLSKYYSTPSSFKASPGETSAGPDSVSSSAADGFMETEYGKQLAQAAEKAATLPGGQSFSVVATVLSRQGAAISGKTAAEAGDKLAACAKFVECTDSTPEQLSELPPGAVVVWASDKDHPLGYCSVALGQGREAAEVVRKQNTAFSDKYRLFLPL